MQPPPFLLDEWLNRKTTPGWTITHDLASSTGPSWTLRQLVDLTGRDALEQLLTTPLVYGPAAGSIELREAIAQLEGVSPDTVQILTGGAEALLILFLLAAEPEANVIVPFPGFPPFAALAATFGTEVRAYRLRREHRFRLDVDEVLGLIDRRTTLLVVNTPHNPTGAVIEPETLRTLHDVSAERGIPFVVDQVYHPIYEGAVRPSATALPHATVLGDFSKALCLPGVRVGWIVERDHIRLERYRNARSYFTVSNPPISEHLAVLAMRHRAAIYARAQKVAQANLILAASFMDQFRDVVDWVRPAGGFVAFPWLEAGSDARTLCEQVARDGVLLCPGDCFGMPAHFRLGVGTEGERFAEGLDRLAAGFARHFRKSTARV